MGKFKNILLIRIGSGNIAQIKHPQHRSPPLSLKYAQALLEQRNYNVKLVDCWVTPISFEGLLEVALGCSAELVIICITTFTSEAGIELSKLIKGKKDIFIVAVGQDVTIRYQNYLALSQIFDVVIRGEFEQELLFLIEQLNQCADIEKIKKFYRQQKSKEVIVVSNLDDLPSLRWKREEFRNYPFIYPVRLKKRVRCGYLLTSRGCSHSCIFCSPVVRKSSGKIIRFRSASKIADEIEELQKIGSNFISFEDDNFTASKEHVFSICAEIQRRSLNIKWSANARIDGATSGLLKVMKNSGCILLFFGVESGSRRVIDILKKNSGRIDWPRRAEDTFRETKKIGISTCALFIIGSPTETMQEIEESMKLAKALRPDIVKVHFFTLYPGSSAYDQFRNRLNQKQLSRQHHYLPPLVNLGDMEIGELRNAQIKFYRNFLFNPCFIMAHLRKYILFYFFNWSVSFKLIKRAFFFLSFRR